ncbi:MAG TPA: DUF1656 domain-containing protein [Alphaproteobacteria bacterium]|jgi:hypothetical protein|nr:DUF1656 domain-containing protein [Alphaproteobacteria bacterium]
MVGEFNFAGVFVPALLVWVLVAVGISMFIRSILRLVGFYRLVWHRGLFDLALLAILWASVTALADSFNQFGFMIH